MVIDKELRKKSRAFRNRIDLMNRIPTQESIQIFFELCNFNLNNYISIEKKRNPNKSTKDIIIKMYEMHKKLKGRKRIHGNKI